MIKKALISLAVTLGVLVILASAYFVMMKSVLNKMTPAETGLITDNIYAIKDSYVNVFLVRSDSGFIMIDAGNDIETIKEGLATLNIAVEDISAIFLTHSDGDHVASILVFPNAKVFLSRQEEQLLTGETSRFFVFGNKIKTDTYSLIDDGQSIQFPGLTIKGILSPGHTPGSMCYLVNDRYLFTGDVLKLINGKVEEFHHFINMDTETDIKSIKKLSQLENIDYIFTAHYGVNDDFDGAFTNW